jgi:imidazole glycerol-phosphate synthase subunit HisF
MLRTRIIPTLLLRHESLVKTVRFNKFTYVGDPCNTVRIFNELEVDELLLLDITATCEHHAPNLKVLAEITNECFMPLSYGGGLHSLEQAKAIFTIGFEKVVVNSFAVKQSSFITQLADHYGSQAIIGSIDVKKNLWGHYKVYTHSGRTRTHLDPREWAVELERFGAGEILLTSIAREGTWQGFDIELVRLVTDAVSIPVIAHGGAGTVAHIGEAIRKGGASAIALGSMVVFQKKGMGVLINFPDKHKLQEALQ